MKFLVILILNIVSFELIATETLLIGGGGEPKGASTIFDDSLVTLSHKKNELQLNLNSYFNGGHSKTEEILRDELKIKNQAFTSKNYKQAVDDYIKKIQNGEIKPGEKLMVILDTHGAVKTSEHKTHSIAMSGSEISNYDQLGNSDHDSVDRLFDLAKMAEAKGVKLAILDFSCHSGNSLALANGQTCVISSSGPNHYGFSNFPSEFYKNMSKGKSLEEVFLNTRIDYTTPSFPMISSPQGVGVNNELYNLISPYINIVTQDGAADKLSPYLNSIFEGDNLCRRENNFIELSKKIENFQKVSGVLRSRFFGGQDLLEELKAFKEMQDNYIKKLEASGLPLLEKVETFSYGEEMNNSQNKGGSKTVKKNKSNEAHGKPMVERLTWKDIITAYPIDTVNYFQENLKTEKDPQARRDYLNAIDKFKKIDLKRQEILKQYPNIASATHTLDNLKMDHQKIWDKASKVTELANKYYDTLYREKLKVSSAEKNPCRDFKL